MTSQKLDLTRKAISIIFQAYLICWMLNNVQAQYDYENEGSSATTGRISSTAALTGTRTRGLFSVPAAEENFPWNRVNQMVLEKCMQLQRMAVRKRNFGLDIPDFIMAEIQNGNKKGSSELEDLRTRMSNSGK